MAEKVELYKGLMIIAQPGDEILYGGGILATSVGRVNWVFVCLTEANTDREAELRAVVAHFLCSGVHFR